MPSGCLNTNTYEARAGKSVFLKFNSYFTVIYPTPNSTDGLGVQGKERPLAFTEFPAIYLTFLFFF